MTHVGSTIRTQVRTHGAVTPDAREYAVEKLEAALHHAPAPVVGSWLTLDSEAHGDRVDAHVNVGGVHLHVHAVGETLQEASDLMQQRLRSCLRRTRRRATHDTPLAVPDDDLR